MDIFIDNATYTYSEGEDLVLEYRNYGKSIGAVLRIHRGEYQAYKIGYSNRLGAWEALELPATLTLSAVIKLLKDTMENEVIAGLQCT